LFAAVKRRTPLIEPDTEALIADQVDADCDDILARGKVFEKRPGDTEFAGGKQ
jgi:hypothetical protein